MASSSVCKSHRTEQHQQKKELSLSNADYDNENNRKILLEQLAQRTYCRLAPSTKHGVGVFAVRDIPAGVQPFRSPFRRPFTIVKLSPAQVAPLPPTSQSLVKDFFMTDSAGNHWATDPSVIDISFYLNDSKSADACNMRCVPCDDGCGYDDLETTRDIRAGEELFLSYDDNTQQK